MSLRAAATCSGFTGGALLPQVSSDVGQYRRELLVIVIVFPWYHGQVYAPFDSLEQVVAMNPKSAGDEFRIMGQDIFNRTCTSCHQPSGLGKEGTAPPLVGSEWVLAPGPERIAHIVLNGLTGPITVKGKEWNLTMVPWKDNYNDKQLAAVLTYIRSTWGNNAPPVKPEQVAAARKDIHPGPMTSPELLQIPVQ